MMRRLALPVLIAASLLACSDTPTEAETSLLGFVPADTPYAFVSGEPLPEDVLARFAALNGSIVNAFKDAVAADPDFPPALAELFVELMTGIGGDGAQAFGMGPNDPYVIYGRGPYPVGRFAISDVSKLQASMAKVERALETEIPTASRNGTTYWRLSGPDFQVMLVAVLENDTLAWAIGPVEQESDLVDHLVSAPSAGAAQTFSTRVSTLRSEYDLEKYPFMFIELEPLVAAVAATSQDLTPGCRDELIGYTKRAPRLIAGYDRITSDTVGYQMTLALDGAAQTALRDALAPIPAGDLGQDSLMSIGLGVDIAKATTSLATAFNASVSSSACSPGSSELIAAEQVQQAVGALQLAGNPRGLRIVWDSIALDNPMAPRVSALALANMEAPSNVLSLIQLQMPIGDVPTDGTPISLSERMPIPMLQDEIWLAADQDGLGLAVGGDDQSARLRSALSAEPLAAGTLLDFQMSGKLFTMVGDQNGPLGSMIAMQAASDPNVTTQLQMFKAYGDLMDRFAYSVALSDKGVMLRQEIKLK